MAPVATTFAGSGGFFGLLGLVSTPPPMPAIACSKAARCSGAIFSSCACIWLRAVSIAEPMRFASARVIST